MKFNHNIYFGYMRMLLINPHQFERLKRWSLGSR